VGLCFCSSLQPFLPQAYGAFAKGRARFPWPPWILIGIDRRIHRTDAKPIWRGSYSSPPGNFIWLTAGL